MDDANWPAMDEKEFAEFVRQAFLRYWDLSRLARLPLAASLLIENCLLAGDAAYPEARGYALRAVLRWTLDKLEARGTVWASQSADVLKKRYVEGKSATEYADMMFISDATAQSRRRSAIKRAAAVLRRELWSSIETAQCKEQMIGLRYNDCSEGEQRVLRFLIVFRQPVPISIQIPLEEAAFQSDVVRLLAANLLVGTVEAGGISVHPEIGSYLYELLTHGERIEWEQVAAAYYQQQGDILEAVYHWQMAGCPERAAALLIARRRELVDGTMPVAPLRERLAGFKRGDFAMDRWAQLKILEGRAEELAGQLEMALRAYREALGAENDQIKAKAYYRLGRVYRQTDLNAARIHFGHSKRLLAEPTQPDHYELVAKICISEAWIFIDRHPDAGQVERNLAQAESALPNCTGSERLLLLSDLYNARAAALYAFRHQDPEKYQEYYIEFRWQAWHYAQEAQDKVRTMNTGHNLGMAYMRHEQYEPAYPLFQESIALAEQFGNRRMVAVNKKALGNWLVLSALDYRQAIPYLMLAYNGLREMGNDLATVCYDLAEAYVWTGQGVVGKSYYDESVSLASALGNETLLHALAALVRQCPELAQDLGARQWQAVDFIRANGAVTNQEYRDLTGISPRTAARDLNDLVDRGICEKVGQGRTTRYQIVQK